MNHLDLPPFRPPFEKESSDEAWTQWKRSGKLEHILDRSQEWKQIKNAYNRVKNSMRSRKEDSSLSVIARGPPQVIFLTSQDAGMGKQTLVRRLEQDVRGTGGYFVAVDCERDSGCDPDPHAPVIHTLSTWAKALSRPATPPPPPPPCENNNTQPSSRVSNNNRDFWSQFQDCLTEQEAHFLCSAVPAFSKPLQGNVAPSSMSDFTSKQKTTLFKLVFAKFVYTMAGLAPSAVALVNMHQSNETMADFMSALLHAEELRHMETPFLFVATYRPNAIRVLYKCVEVLRTQLVRRGMYVTEIMLQPLEKEELLSRLKQNVIIENDSTAENLISIAQGSPLYLEELTRTLVSRQVLTQVDGEWIMSEHSTFTNSSLLDLLGVHLLRTETLQFLQIMACLGTRTSRFLLEESRACRSLEDELRILAARGIIGYDESECFFSHEALRNLVYENIPLEARPRFHHQIAENLWLSFDLDQIEKYLTVLVGQLLKGSGCISSKRRRQAAAQLCLRAGEASANVSAYHSSFLYFTAGIDLLDGDWDGDYELCLTLHNLACEVAYCVARFDELLGLAETVIDNAKSFRDTLRVQVTKINTIATRTAVEESILYANLLLERMGEKIDMHSNQWKARGSIRRALRRLRRVSDDQILRLPYMVDGDKLSVMRIITCFLPKLITRDHFVAAGVVERAISLTLEHGISALTCIGFGLFATVLCWHGEVKAGQRYGELSLRLAKLFDVDTWLGRSEALYYGNSFCWTHPFKDAIAPLRSARARALAAGDVETAMLNANLVCLIEFDFLPIPLLLEKILEYHDSMKAYGQDFNLGILHPYSYILVRCSGKNADQFPAVREAAQRIAPFSMEIDPSSMSIQWANFSLLLVHFLFGEFEAAIACSQFCSFLLEHPHGSADSTLPCLIDCLLTIERLRQNRWNVPLLWRLRRRIRQLDSWANACPVNFLGELHLVEAEWASLVGKRKKAHRKYTSAISLLKESGFYLQTAIALEMAGKCFLRMGEHEEGRKLLGRAIDKYREWGGDAKANHLAAEAKC